MIRGHSVQNPVLLFLAGGPGGSEMGAMRNHLPGLEQRFTVVTWDQRGTGRSYDELDPSGTYTLASAVDDTIAVTNHLRDRFGQDRIYLLGQSWGSTLGVLAVQQHPELYGAFIGTGQMVSQLATDTIFYNDTLDWARTTGDTDLAADLVHIGPPPYDRMLDYETALSSEHEVYPYDHAANSEGEGGFSENFFVPEYSLIDQVHLLGAFMDTFSVLYPQLQDIDFRRTATDFDDPDVLRARRTRSRRPRRCLHRLVPDDQRPDQRCRRPRHLGTPTPVGTARRVHRLHGRHGPRANQLDELNSWPPWRRPGLAGWTVRGGRRRNHGGVPWVVRRRLMKVTSHSTNPDLHAGGAGASARPSPHRLRKVELIGIEPTTSSMPCDPRGPVMSSQVQQTQGFRTPRPGAPVTSGRVWHPSWHPSAFDQP